MAKSAGRIIRGAIKRLRPIRYFPALWRLGARDDLRRRFDDLDLKSSPTLVLGSAPNSAQPVGIDDHWVRFTANGAQGRLADWELSPPNLTLMRSSAAVPPIDRVWERISGMSTERLFSAGSPGHLSQLGATAASHSYAVGKLITADWLERMLLIYEMSGIWMIGRPPEDTPSNGILGVLLALFLGASAVVIAGVSLRTNGGHFYSEAQLSPRYQIKPDREVIAALVRRNAPIFTSDADFSSDTGVALWGEAEARRWTR